MLDWITDNYAIISVLINLGMLIVWIVYLQLFLASYSRQLRPKFLINVGAGRSLDARCLLSNMSTECIYVESLIATLESKAKRWTCPVTDVEKLTQEQRASDPRLLTRQGPLKSGEVMDIGSFRDLISRVLANSGRPAGSEEEFPDDLSALQIEVVADFGPDDLLVGAKRRFGLVRRDGRWGLSLQNSYTEQVRSRRERKKLMRRLEKVDP